MNINLKGHNMKRSWRLFSQLAFEEGKEPNNPELVAVAKNICKQCVGVPLAIEQWPISRIQLTVIGCGL